MPDLDKFERGLGKDWRRAYRLARVGSPLSAIVDCLMTAAASALRGDSASSAVSEILHAFLEARQRMSQMDLGLYASGPVQAHHGLCQKLEEIQQSHVASPATRQAARAALSLWSELESDGSSGSASDVQLGQKSHQRRPRRPAARLFSHRASHEGRSGGLRHE